MTPESFSPKNSRETLRTKYEPLLWKRAEELSEMKKSLENLRDELYKEIESLQAKNPDIFGQDIIRKKQTEYWRVEKSIQEISVLEKELETHLYNLENNIANPTQLIALFPKEELETEHLSKRKKRIREEMERLGIDPREMEYRIHQEFGSNPTHLSTGRHQKGIKGNFDPLTASSEFFYRTADTHGGKVGHGKKGSSYVTSGGKRIRKR